MNHKLIFLSVLMIFSFQTYSQSALGIWKNIEDDELQSHIEIFESEGKVHARVIELFPNSKVTHCKKCKGDDKGASLKDILIIEDMKYEDGKWVDGDILDPNKGKTYSCQMELDGDNTLKIRGYLGKPMFGKTFYWYRVE